MQLNDVEYKILNHINTIKNTHGENLEELFPENKFLVSPSLEILDKSRLIESELVEIPNENSCGKTMVIAKKITNEGKKALYDYEKNQELLQTKQATEQERIEREKKHVQLAEEANFIARKAKKDAKFANYVAFFSLLVAIIALFKK